MNSGSPAVEAIATFDTSRVPVPRTPSSTHRLGRRFARIVRIATQALRWKEILAIGDLGGAPEEPKRDG